MSYRESEADVKRATSWHELKARAEKAERERDGWQGEYDWLIDEINRRLGLPEDEFHSPSPALDGIAELERERDEARAALRVIEEHGTPGDAAVARDALGEE